MMSDMPEIPEPFDSERFLAALAEEPLKTEPSTDLHRWYERAAVLAWFEPRMIGAPSDSETLLDSDDWIALIADCEIARTAENGCRRRLKLVKRREVIAGLEDREDMRRALQETVDPPRHDPVQQALDALIQGERIDVSSLPQERLYALHIATEWLRGLLEDLPDSQEIANRLRLDELLQPHRVLVGTGFVGRRKELDELRRYVEELPSSSLAVRIIGGARNLAHRVLDHPPLVIFGPRGVGKSTLIARFVLDHAEERGLVFVDLDFGRPNLDPRWPVTLLAEAARQIATQVPSRLAEGDALAEDLEWTTVTSARGQEEAVQVVGLTEAVERFAAFASAALPPGHRLPFVLDTFEEVEALGETRVEGIWSLLRQLQKHLPQLRPIICSHAPPPNSVLLYNIPLSDLEPAAAEHYLRARLGVRHGRKLSEKVIADVVAKVVRTPLGLNLAADLLVQAVDAGKDPARVVARMAGRADEAFLYRRILSQIKNPKVRRLATPSLTVRRLDPDVVREVLAGPCAVDVPNRLAAERLLDRLAAQVALVERQPDGTLEHRPDVRCLMLPAIAKSVGATLMRKIDHAAADYYKGVDSIIGRTERAYHLLRLGALDEAEPLLTGDVASRLRRVLEELEPDARLVLKLRLGITCSPEELSAADDARWEKGAIAAAEDDLRRGAYDKVLSLLATRPDRRRGRPLDRIEAEAKIGLGDLTGALATAESGSRAAEIEGERDTAVALALSMVRASLALGRLETAAEALARTESMVTATDSPDVRLRILITQIRLAHLRGDSTSVEKALRRASDMLDGDTLSRLQPTVLRDLAGELGSMGGVRGEPAARILRTALRRVGIEQKTAGVVQALADTIAEWIKAGGIGASDVWRLLSSIGNVPPPPPSLNDINAWNDWLNKVPGSQLGQAMASLLRPSQSSDASPYIERLQGILTTHMADAARAAEERGLRRNLPP